MFRDDSLPPPCRQDEPLCGQGQIGDNPTGDFPELLPETAVQGAMPPCFAAGPFPADFLDQYRSALGPTGGHLRDRFERTVRGSTPGAAQLEAVTFSVMKHTFNLNPQIHEDPSSGGADFKLNGPTYLEIKYLDRIAVAEKSRLVDAPIVDDHVYNPEGITSLIQTAVKGTTRQLAACIDGSGIAIVGTDHLSARMIMDFYAAEKVLTSSTELRAPIATGTRTAGLVQHVAPLLDSVFLENPAGPGDDLGRLRVPVSAVLLVCFHVADRWATLIGALNPWPLRPLDTAKFPGIPFVRFSTPPTISARTLPSLEWITA